MPQKSSPSSPSSVDEEPRGALAFDKTLDRREPTPKPASPVADLPDAALAPTQDASRPLRPPKPAPAIAAAAGDHPPEEDRDDHTADLPQPVLSDSTRDDADSEDDDSESGSTRSIGAVRSGAGISAPRSAPSVPYVGIPRSLQKWDRYEVQAVLGAGGMGAVYRARDPRLDRMVALKIIHPRLGQDDDTHGDGVVRRFLREARLQASLEHPHICKVYEIGELPTVDGDASHPYICMQLIAGQPLHRAQSDMSLFEKVRVIQQVAEALHTAHKQGLIHRVPLLHQKPSRYRDLKWGVKTLGKRRKDGDLGLVLDGSEQGRAFIGAHRAQEL